MWALLVLDMLFWSVPVPLVAVIVWICARAALLLASLVKAAPVPDWLTTPWDLLCIWYLRGHGVRVVDAEGTAASSLRIPGIQDFSGVVLANHRSWGDFVIDPYQAYAPVVSRAAAVAVTLFAGMVGWLSNRIIVIVRGRTSRQQLKDKCARYARYLIFPEGTRRASAPDKDECTPLRIGGLKNVYETGAPALIAISVNKEFIVDEKRGVVKCRTSLYRARHAPVLPADFGSFEAFHAAIEEAWQRTWRQAYDLRSKHNDSFSTDSLALL